MGEHGCDGSDSGCPGTGGATVRGVGDTITTGWRGGTPAGIESVAEGGLEVGPTRIVAREGGGLSGGGGGYWGDSGGYGGVRSAILHHTPAHTLTATTTVHALQGEKKIGQ